MRECDILNEGELTPVSKTTPVHQLDISYSSASLRDIVTEKDYKSTIYICYKIQEWPIVATISCLKRIPTPTSGILL